MFHQEIEFTFESDDPADLYILQTRDARDVADRPRCPPSFPARRSRARQGGHRDRRRPAARSPAASPTPPRTSPSCAQRYPRRPDHPAAAGHRARRHSADPARRRNGHGDRRGDEPRGARRAAARPHLRRRLPAARGLRRSEKRSELAGQTIKTGDFISINGSDGSVYLGKHPVDDRPPAEAGLETKEVKKMTHKQATRPRTRNQRPRPDRKAHPLAPRGPQVLHADRRQRRAARSGATWRRCAA